MKYLILLCCVVFISGCAKHYTNEECVKKVSQALHLYNRDIIDRDFLIIGTSIECSKNNNDPQKTLEALLAK